VISPVVFPKVIAFFGPDGAGKSTQADLLIRFLESKRLRVKKAWLRSTHTVAFLLWLTFKKLNLIRDNAFKTRLEKFRPAVSYLNESTYGAVSPITTSPPILRGSISRYIWSSIELIGLLPIILLQVYLPKLLGMTIVAERYVVDSVASIAYFIDDESFVDSINGKFLLKLIPNGTCFIYVDADYQTILARRSESAGPPEYTEFHRRIYRKLAPIVSAQNVNTTFLTIEQAQERIIDFISANKNSS
jgi:thymidylate kinase